MSAATLPTETSDDLRAIVDTYLGSHAALHVNGYGPGRNDSCIALVGAATSKPECARDFTFVQEFAALPSIRALRWLVPLETRDCTLRGMDIYTPYTRTARVQKALLTTLMRLGCSRLFRDHVIIASKVPFPLQQMVAEVTGVRNSVFCISRGVPHRLANLTVQAMRPDGSTLGFIKLPLTEETLGRVRHEAETLIELWDCAPLRPHIPRVLCAREWNGSYLLFQTAGPSTPGPAAFNRTHSEFLRLLWDVHSTEISSAALIQAVENVWKLAHTHLDREFLNLGGRALDCARHILDSPIRCGVYHGDFAPSNTRLGKNGLFVFDWERADWDMPNLWDIFHFQVQASHWLRRDPRTFWASTRKSCGLELTPEQQALFLLYLLDSCSLWIRSDSDCTPGIEYRRRLIELQLNTLGNQS